MTEVMGVATAAPPPNTTPSTSSEQQQQIHTIVFTQQQQNNCQQHQNQQSNKERAESVNVIHQQQQTGFQHMNPVQFNVTNTNSAVGNGYDNNNNNSNNSNGENGEAQTFTTLTTFRSHQPLLEVSNSGDEYMPNGGNLVFNIASGIIMQNNNGGVENGNNLSLGNHSHHQMQSQQQLHQQHVQIPSHFLQNIHPGTQHLLPPPHLVSHIGGDPYMVVPNNAPMIAPSSSSGTSTPQPGNHHIIQQHSNHHQSVLPQQTSIPSSSSSTGSVGTSSNPAESAADPYLCAWCTFTTVYKGNMKRHLISCHNGITDELLRRLSFDVDRLRKNCPNRPHIQELPIMPKVPRQSTTSGDKSDKPKVPRTNGTGSGRKRLTNNGDGPEPNRGRPRKNPKGYKPLNNVTNSEEQNIKQEFNLKQEMVDNEVLRINGGTASSSPSAIPVRLNSGASASSSPLPPISSCAPTSAAPSPLISMGGHSQLMVQTPHGITQLHQGQFTVPHSAAGQLPPPQFVPAPPQLFMVMNPTINALSGAVQFPPHSTAVFADPSQNLQPQLHQLTPVPQQQLHQIETVSNSGHINGVPIPQPLYIPSQPTNFHYQPTQGHLQPQFQQLAPLSASIHQQLIHAPAPAFSSAFKLSSKECSNDSGISLHSFNAGVDL